MPSVDRGGGRESKGGSLRKSKIGRADKAKLAASTPREARPDHAPAAPPVQELPAAPLPLLFDAGAALLSRQFDRDREAVLRRAGAARVAAVLVSSVDAEKQRDVAQLARSSPGVLYACVGVLPDCVKRTNDKQAAEWVDMVRELALTVAEVAAVQCGLNLELAVATHHAQEGLLRSQAALAASVRLPLVVHAPPGESLSRALELVLEAAEQSGDEPPLRFALNNAGQHAAEALEGWCAAGGCLLLSACGLSDGGGAGLAGLLARWPGRALLQSGSPSFTPQTLADEYLRTLRNEPSNLPQVSADCAASCGVDEPAMREALWTASLTFFGLGDAASPAAAAPPSPARAAAADSSSSEEEEEAAVAPKASPRSRRPAQPAPAREAEPAAPDVAHYACKRCRRPLFVASLQLNHSGGGGAGADDNLCLAHVFLPMAAPQAGLSVAAEAGEEEAGRLSCAHCAAKLGRLFAAEGACACGARLPGPVAKLYTSRLDFVVAGASEDAAREAMRALQLHGEREAAALERGENEERGKADKRRAKGPTGDNKMNLSSYRNKDGGAAKPKGRRRGAGAEDDE